MGRKKLWRSPDFFDFGHEHPYTYRYLTHQVAIGHIEPGRSRDDGLIELTWETGDDYSIKRRRRADQQLFGLRDALICPVCKKAATVKWEQVPHNGRAHVLDKFERMHRECGDGYAKTRVQVVLPERARTDQL